MVQGIQAQPLDRGGPRRSRLAIIDANPRSPDIGKLCWLYTVAMPTLYCTTCRQSGCKHQGPEDTQLLIGHIF